MRCATCNQVFEGRKRKYCSKQCRDRRPRPSRAGKESSHRKRGPFICEHCGKEYYTRRPKGEGERFCSRECAFKANANREWKYWGPYSEVPEYTLITYNECSRCKKIFVSTRKKQRCNECGNTQKPYIKQCNVCSKYFHPTKIGQIQCSERCKQEAKKEQKRANKARRRAKEKSTNVETIKPVDIFNRDRWKCKACGIGTPMKYRGTYKNNAPELDHIIPLAKGGAHIKDNLQCLCRKCNRQKGTRTMQEYCDELYNITANREGPLHRQLF